MAIKRLFKVRGLATFEGLITTPLGGLHVANALLGLGDSHLRGHLGEGSLVLAHVDSEGLEVVKLAGETHSTAIDEHPVTGLVGDLVHLEETLTLHGRLSLHEEVLANAHRPATAHSGHDTHVLVNESVDLGRCVGHLDHAATEDWLELGSTSAKALSLASAHRGECSDRVEEVSEGGEVAALTLGNVLLELVSASGSVGLEGKVVIGDLLVVTLDQAEELVTSALDALGHLDEHGALDTLEGSTGTLHDGNTTSLTHLNGADDLLVQVSVEGSGLGLDQVHFPLASGLLVTDDTSEASEERLSLAVVGGHSVGEGGETSTELLLGLVESRTGAGRVSSNAAGVGTVAAGVQTLLLGKRSVHLLGGTSQVLSGILGIASRLGADSTHGTASGASELGDLEGSGTLVLIQELAELATSTDGGRLTVVGKLGDTTELGTSATVDTHLLGAVGGNLAGHDGDLTREASLEVLDSGGHTVEGGSERLASVADVTLGLGTGTGDVLHSVGETVVSESSLPGDLLVDLVDSTTHGGISVGAVLGELLVGLGHGSLEGGQDSHLAGSRGSVGTDGSSGTLA